MFARWGDVVCRWRFGVIAVVAAGLLALSGYGWGVQNLLYSGGMDDPNSPSTEAAVLADQAFGRNHDVDVAVLYTAPAGKTVDDPDFSSAVVASLNSLPHRYPDEIAKVNLAYWPTETGSAAVAAATKDKTRAIATIALKDTADTSGYESIKNAFAIPGIDVQVGGLQPVASALQGTVADDMHRMEVLAIPLVAVLLFFVFGGVVAAALPLIVGVLTVGSANGIVRIITHYTPVNSFVAPVVSMVGLGLAIDYGLFIVSRFREELAAGRDVPTAVRRTVMTAGRTVVFSATMIIASLGGLLLFPQGFLKSIAYGAIATVALAALSAITILPAVLAILGRRVDALGLKRFRRTRTAAEIDASLWSRSTSWVIRNPHKVAIPIVIGLFLLILPIRSIAFGGFTEKYLPPDNPTRVAQEQIDKYFPFRKSDPLQLIFITDNPTAIGPLVDQANKAPGLTSAGFGIPSRSTTQPDVFRTTATMVDSSHPDAAMKYLRGLPVPDGTRMIVGGVPAIQYDTIAAMLDRVPLMILLVFALSTILMFLTFGSLILPLKAAFMSALGLGSTLGILSWIFVEGHGSGLLNFTPQPIQANVLAVIIAIIYGLSTDYEVFLVSRMVEARARGATTSEAIREGTAHTGRIITAAALILFVVTGAFAFSDLVMMQYIAYGMIAALFIDATLLRMLLVPATMQLLGDRCWWAPAWMKRIQRRIGLGEAVPDEFDAEPQEFGELARASR